MASYSDLRVERGARGEGRGVAGGFALGDWRLAIGDWRTGEEEGAVVAVDVIGGGFDPGFGEEFADGLEEGLVGEARSARGRRGKSAVGFVLGAGGLELEDAAASA